ncbi:hypothetical protein [Nonomuraea longispora]|uniref:hypothetical protein n=1 Tax=Nonomuraea longispora TaxID=1848320 RepID=UPI0014048A14|nr:hypothetical protein [Nonomuraea longispora]
MPARDRDARGPQLLDRRHGIAVDGPGRERHARVGEAPRQPVDAGRVDAADRLDAALQRLFEQLGGARVGQHAVLREGDLTHVDRGTGGRLAHGLHAAQPDLGVDVGAGAHMGGAGRAHELQQRADPLDARHARLAAAGEVVADAAGERVVGGVRHPGPAVEGLVEVAVGLDEAGQHQLTRDVDHVGGGRVHTLADPGDPAVADEDVGG